MISEGKAQWSSCKVECDYPLSLIHYILLNNNIIFYSTSIKIQNAEFPEEDADDPLQHYCCVSSSLNRYSSSNQITGDRPYRIFKSEDSEGRMHSLKVLNFHQNDSKMLNYYKRELALLVFVLWKYFFRRNTKVQGL